jgi:hypothetical protein
MLVNASDNNAHVRCEATNSATEIPLLKVLVLKVNCKILRTRYREILWAVAHRGAMIASMTRFLLRSSPA